MGVRVIKAVVARSRHAAKTFEGDPIVAARSLHRGHAYELSEAEEARLDRLGALFPPDVTEPIDLQEAERRLVTVQPSASPPSLGAAPTGAELLGDTGIGDTPAPEDELEPIVEASGPFDARGATLEEAQAWLEGDGGDKPSAPRVVEAAHDDPGAAKLLLEAENLVTGQDPRKTVEKPLKSIIDGA